jgi:hypothetical protein
MWLTVSIILIMCNTALLSPIQYRLGMFLSCFHRDCTRVFRSSYIEKRWILLPLLISVPVMVRRFVSFPSVVHCTHCTTPCCLFLRAFFDDWLVALVGMQNSQCRFTQSMAPLIIFRGRVFPWLLWGPLFLWFDQPIYRKYKCLDVSDLVAKMWLLNLSNNVPKEDHESFKIHTHATRVLPRSTKVSCLKTWDGRSCCRRPIQRTQKKEKEKWFKLRSTEAKMNIGCIKTNSYL